MLHQQTKELLIASKNLLAFSAGGDSTALFFLLLENEIPFDIAIVDYGVRAQSKAEVLHAQTLAQKYGKECFVKQAPKIEKNFEAQARAIRYGFFENLVEKHGYENLLTAHHLGDRFEWMLMQFCKGAGCVELAGMQEVEIQTNYTLVRPLLHLEKGELQAYLETRQIEYFEDESNSDQSYKRNYFRHNFAQPMLQKYKAGIKKSFEYLDKDIEYLLEDVALKSINQLTFFKTKNFRTNTKAIDRYLKSIGHMITANEKLLLLDGATLVVGRKYIVAQQERYVFIAPYIQAQKMQKTLKEKFRKLRIAKQLRGYLASDEEALEFVSLLLE